MPLNLAVLLMPLTLAHAQEPVATVELELRGPLQELRVEAGRAATHVRSSLAEGESRRLLVPVEVHDSADLVPPTTDASPERARVLGPLTPPEPWSGLPRALQARALPALELERPRPGAARLAWLAAAALLAFAARRRPALAAGVGLVGALGVFLLPTPAARASVSVVLEGDAASGRWLEVRGARDRLELASGGPFWTRALPSAEDLHFEVEAREGRPRWRVRADGARLYAMRELLPAPALTRQANRLEDFDRVWIREPGAGWSTHGAWKRGAALPAEELGGEGVPGWLAAALPQGVGVLVGRSSSSEGPRWVRLVGF